jgi:hypothetical protein
MDFDGEIGEYGGGSAWPTMAKTGKFRIAESPAQGEAFPKRAGKKKARFSRA